MYINFLISLMLWRESSGESLDGWKAILCVLRNRVTSGESHWSDYFKVVTEKNAFSSMTYLGDGQTIRWPLPSDLVFNQMYNLVTRFLQSSKETFPDITNGAKYYCNPKNISLTSWFSEKIIADEVNHPLTVVIGRHDFYK